MNHLLLGRLVEQGRVGLDDTVRDHLPEIGSGYADATLRDVFDMNVANDYSEDYADIETTASLHEAVMGWRLPGAGEDDVTNRDFVCRIESDDIVNHAPTPLYKSANADVLAWVAERVSGRSLHAQLIDIVEAAGLEHTFHVSTDRAAPAQPQRRHLDDRARPRPLWPAVRARRRGRQRQDGRRPRLPRRGAAERGQALSRRPANGCATAAIFRPTAAGSATTATPAST